MTLLFNKTGSHRNVKKTLATLIALLFAIISKPGLPASAEVVATGLRFPEGTIFVGSILYFVDYAASSVFRLENGRGQSIWHRDNCGANGLVEVDGGLLVACYDEGTVTRIGLDGKTIASFSKDSSGQPLVNPNDLAKDIKGGVYFTASGENAKKSGKVYYLLPGDLPRQVAAEIDYANGVAVSPDGHRLYVGESGVDRILMFDILADGSLENRRTFLDLNVVLAGNSGDRHTPDGIRADKQGHIFVSLYRGGGCAIFDEDGNLISQIALPGQHHANLSISPDEKSIYGTISYDSSLSGRSGGLYRVPNPVIGK
jgi:gluconolactonase